MSIPKNPNESAYVGGKKHWVDVIKNTGAGGLLLWRQPEEDFNTNSTLIVMPGEEAIFIKSGNIEQVFDSGTYKLSSQNYPVISRLRNWFSGGISTFNCVVYFVRKSHSMEILWGTSSPIQVRDPKLMIATSVRARGAYKVQIDDGAKFLIKLLGNNVDYALQEQLSSYFDNEFQQHIKSSIARAIKESDNEILGICAEQDVLANKIQPMLGDIFSEYGIKLVSFSISGIDIPENDPNRQKLEEAYANRGVMNILGPEWGRQQATEILHDLANNPGAGGVAAAGAGLGMGMAAGSVFSGMAQQMFSPINPQEQNIDTRRTNQTGRFTQKTNEDTVNTPQRSVADELMKLKALVDAGILTQEEFEAQKQKLLNS